LQVYLNDKVSLLDMYIASSPYRVYAIPPSSNKI
jgi:hypothetical protein